MNRSIITAVLGISALAVLHHYLAPQPANASVTRILIGAFVLLLVLAILDTFGGPVSALASAIAMLALLVAVLTYGGPVFLGLFRIASGTGGGQS